MYFNIDIKAVCTTVSYVTGNIPYVCIVMRANVWWSALEFGGIIKHVCTNYQI